MLHSSGTRSIKAAQEVCTVDPAKELFIVDVSVVDDCYRTTWTGSCPGTVTPATRGAWTFGRLMEGVFGTNDPKLLSHGVRHWLKLWMEDDVVNGDTIPARPAIRDLVLRPWERASDGPVLDMKKAPFRLLAIIHRMDIGVHAKKAGELRFIFNLLDENGESTPFTTIFEYTIVSNSCQETLDYAHSLHALSSLDFGPEFNATLQGLTDRVVTRDRGPGLLNGSALLSLRTNEAFLGTPWELRSFTLALPEDDDEEEDDGGNGAGNLKPKARLAHVLQVDTPAERFQGTQTLADFITEFAPGLLSGGIVLPPTYRGEPFLAGAARNDLSLGWSGPAPICTSSPRIPRRLLSLRTCQGCHGADTGTQFTHVSPRQAGEPATVSKFVNGPFVLVRDNCNLGVPTFDMVRRKNFQCALLTQTCAN